MSWTKGCDMKFENIKTGDEVLLIERHSESLQKVGKVTKTRFEVRGYTFTKDGKEYGGSRYSYGMVKLLTEDEKKEFLNKEKEKHKRRMTIADLEKIRFKDLSTEKLLKIIKIANEA